MDYAAQGRGWQGHISFKKVSLAKDTTLMGILWPFDSLITQVNSLDRDKGLSAVRCLYWISSKVSVYPAYTSAAVGPLIMNRFPFRVGHRVILMESL
jgi:hypothetical protein